MGRANHLDRADEVGIDLSADLLIAHLLGGAKQPIPGIADDDVDLSQRRKGLIDDTPQAVVLSSLLIHTIRLWGPFSPIHLLSILTLALLPLAVAHARRHAVERHRRAMMGLFLGALAIAGVFTFLPGRIMHAVVFGT